MQTPPLSNSAQPVGGSERSTTRPTAATLPGAEAASQPAIDPADLKALQAMTPEERKKYMDSLSPEQQAAIQKLMQARPRRGGDPNSRGPRGAGPDGGGAAVPAAGGDPGGGGRGGRGGGGGGGGGRGGAGPG
jgi:hypothetical protein